MKTKLILIAIWLVALPLITACNVHYGSPQSVWLYCTMLGWCTP